MLAYVARRLFFAVFVLWGAVTIIFLVLRLVPGDPAALMLGSDATPQQLAELRAEMGLDQSLVVQYVAYLGDVVRLDFGESLRLHRPAAELVLSRLPETAILAVAAMTLSLVVGVAMGVLAAVRPHTFWDRLVSLLSMLGHSVPAFWVGLMLILLFARTWQVLPSGGASTWAHLVLPAVTLALPFLSLLVRLVRSGLLEVAHEGYVQTARAKGLAEHVVVMRHAIRNALIPVVTVVSLHFGALLGGTVIVETVFSWPGIGRLLVDSIDNRDYTVVQAAVFLIAMIFVLTNLVVDVLYGYLDPRIRLVD